MRLERGMAGGGVSSVLGVSLRMVFGLWTGTLWLEVVGNGWKWLEKQQPAKMSTSLDRASRLQLVCASGTSLHVSVI